MAQQKKSSFPSDCEKELMRSGEDASRAAEICKGGEEREAQEGGKGFSEGREFSRRVT